MSEVVTQLELSAKEKYGENFFIGVMRYRGSDVRECVTYDRHGESAESFTRKSEDERIRWEDNH